MYRRDDQRRHQIKGMVYGHPLTLKKVRSGDGYYVTPETYALLSDDLIELCLELPLMCQTRALNCFKNSEEIYSVNDLMTKLNGEYGEYAWNEIARWPNIGQVTVTALQNAFYKRYAPTIQVHRLEKQIRDLEAEIEKARAKLAELLERRALLDIASPQ